MDLLTLFSQVSLGGIFLAAISSSGRQMYRDGKSWVHIAVKTMIQVIGAGALVGLTTMFPIISEKMWENWVFGGITITSSIVFVIYFFKAVSRFFGGDRPYLPYSSGLESRRRFERDSWDRRSALREERNRDAISRMTPDEIRRHIRGSFDEDTQEKLR